MAKRIAILLTFIAYAYAYDAYVASKTNTAFAVWNYKCDESSDNVEIQYALDLVKSKGGGTVWLSDGLFVLSKNVAINGNDITIRGIEREKTVLRLKDGAAKFSKAGFIRSIDTQNISIRDMTLDGNRAKQSTSSDTNYGRYGVFTETCNNTVFDNLKVINWYGYGIDPHGEGGVYNPGYNCKVTNCWVENNGFDGITIDKTEGTLVAGNTVVNNGRHGINVVTGSKNTNVISNIVINNGWSYLGSRGIGCGVMYQNNQGFDTRDGFVSSNLLRNSSRAGICLTDVENIRISTNTIENTALCMRVKLIDSGDNIMIDSDNYCRGTAIKSDTTPYTGPTPVFLTA